MTGFDPSRSLIAGLGVLAGSALVVLAVVLIVQAIVR